MFTAQFRRLLCDSGVQAVRLPPKSPNLNAYAERFVGSVRRECLDKLVLLGERHLRRVVNEYVDHYHEERTHQALGNALIDPRAEPSDDDGHVCCRKRLGGVLNFYYREAT